MANTGRPRSQRTKTAREAPFAALLDAIPNVLQAAKEMGLPTSTLRHWRVRDNVPRAYWELLLVWARRKGLNQINMASLTRASEVVAKRQFAARSATKRRAASPSAQQERIR
jgi:hypothetical protein